MLLGMAIDIVQVRPPCTGANDGGSFAEPLDWGF